MNFSIIYLYVSVAFNAYFIGQMFATWNTLLVLAEDTLSSTIMTNSRAAVSSLPMVDVKVMATGLAATKSAKIFV